MSHQDTGDGNKDGQNKDGEDRDETRPPQQHTRMAVPPDSEPGLETDGAGNIVPFARRTREDQDKARRTRKP